MCGEKYEGDCLNEDDIGITPACAGKSPIGWQKAFASRDHPRVCGEKLFGAWLLIAQSGSPPRVRGKGFHMKYQR